MPYDSVQDCSYIEIAFDKLDLISHPGLSGELSRAFDLVCMVVDSSHFAIGKRGDLSGWPSNPTTNIQNPHTLLKAKLESKHMLISRDSLSKGFPGEEAAEVKRLSPSLFVELCYNIIVSFIGLLARYLRVSQTSGWLESI